MRIKLETALDNEAKIRFQLEQEKHKHKSVEHQVGGILEQGSTPQHVCPSTQTTCNSYHTALSLKVSHVHCLCLFQMNGTALSLKVSRGH